jgi:hypothetical protein
MKLTLNQRLHELYESEEIDSKYILGKAIKRVGPPKPPPQIKTGSRIGNYEVEYGLELKDVFPKDPETEKTIGKVTHAIGYIDLIHVKTGDHVRLTLTNHGIHHDSRSPSKSFSAGYIIGELQRMLGPEGLAVYRRMHYQIAPYIKIKPGLSVSAVSAEFAVE